MILPISMLKIQELPGDMPLDPHRGSAPGSRSPRLAAIEGLPPPPPPPASTLSGSGPARYRPMPIFYFRFLSLDFQQYSGHFEALLHRYKLILCVYHIILYQNFSLRCVCVPDFKIANSGQVWSA